MVHSKFLSVCNEPVMREELLPGTEGHLMQAVSKIPRFGGDVQEKRITDCWSAMALAWSPELYCIVFCVIP